MKRSAGSPSEPGAERPEAQAAEQGEFFRAVETFHGGTEEMNDFLHNEICRLEPGISGIGEFAEKEF